jgi:hypothetical protein
MGSEQVRGPAGVDLADAAIVKRVQNSVPSRPHAERWKRERNRVRSSVHEVQECVADNRRAIVVDLSPMAAPDIIEIPCEVPLHYHGLS